MTLPIWRCLTYWDVSMSLFLSVKQSLCLACSRLFVIHSFMCMGHSGKMFRAPSQTKKEDSFFVLQMLATVASPASCADANTIPIWCLPIQAPPMSEGQFYPWLFPWRSAMQPETLCGFALQERKMLLHSTDFGSRHFSWSIIINNDFLFDEDSSKPKQACISRAWDNFWSQPDLFMIFWRKPVHLLVLLLLLLLLAFH